MSASDHFSRSVLQRMLTQLNEEPFEDVVVEVGGKTFQCHRFILSACSMFFQALFRSGMREAIDQMVELKDVAPDTFQLILNCIYGGENVVTRDNVLSIWQAATLLQIDFLKESCEIFLRENSDKENCVDVHICAKMLSCDHVSNIAWDIILKEFDYLVTSEGVFMLNFNDMERLVGSDDLRVQSEDTVVYAIKEWTRFQGPAATESSDADGTKELQPEKNLATKAKFAKGKKAKEVETKNENPESTALRQGGDAARRSFRDQENRLATLLGASRLCLASVTCLQGLLADPKVIYNPEALQHVRNALRYHLQPERRYDFCPRAAVFRSGNDWTNVIFSLSSPYSTNHQPKLLFKRFPQDDWHTLMTGASSYYVIQEQCNTVVYGSSIFGTTCDVPRNYTFMFRFNLQKNDLNFAMIGQALKNRVNHTLVCHKNFLYIMGGDNGEVSIDRFNLDEQASSQWETVGTLLQAVSDVTATVFNNLIIIVGNIKKEDENETTALIQCFDPETSSTYLLADSLPQASEKRVFLKRWSEVYLLQEGGCLWHLQQSEEKDRVSLEYHGRLWSSPVDITSAAIFREELIVLAKPPAAAVASAAEGQGEGQSQDKEDVHTRWETPHHELFKRVHVLREDSCCLMTGVVQSALVPNTR